MDTKESKKAAEALIQWFASQDIGPTKAMVVLSMVMETIVVTLAEFNKKKSIEGLDAITQDMRRHLKEHTQLW